MTAFVPPHGGPPPALIVLMMALWLEVAVVSGLFGYGVARESKSRLVRITGYLLVLNVPLMPIGMLFSYGVARESPARSVRTSGTLLSASLPLSVIAGTLWAKPILACLVIVLLVGGAAIVVLRQGMTSTVVTLAAGIPIAAFLGLVGRGSPWLTGLLWTIIIGLAALFSLAVARESRSALVRESAAILSVTAAAVVPTAWIAFAAGL